MKRKLKDLKENECIKVSTLAQAKYFIEKIGFHKTTAKDLVGHFILTHSASSSGFGFGEETHGVEYPASDFIKKKKSKFKKYVEQEFAKIDSKINDIEIKLGKHFSVDASKILVNDIAIKDAEYITEMEDKSVKEDVSKTEITELPEKWCVLITDNTLQYVNRYGAISPYDYNLGCYAHFPSYSIGYSKGLTSSEKIQEGYTEISFSDFERLVLKKEVLEKSEQLEVGKWYKDNGKTKFLFFASNIQGHNAHGYGFAENGEWFSTYTSVVAIKKTCRLATNEEVEQALVAEAKRRYNESQTIKSLFEDDWLFKINDNFRFYLNEKETRLLSGNGCVFYNGKWAEIEQPKEEIDWSLPGQLFQNIDYPDVFVMNCGSYNPDIFGGVFLEGHLDLYPKGCYGTYPTKYYRLYKGEITLKNE